MPILTLTTDFGIEDEYVGVMKGVVHRIHPAATIIDITHYIQPQDVIQAAYTIASSYHYFSSGSVHLIVVDPGVGSDRRIIALEKQGHFFLAPNNGVLTLLFDDKNTEAIVDVRNSRYFLEPVSQTFHGRDIFAPVGAHILSGISLSDLGDFIEPDQVVRFNVTRPLLRNRQVTGRIVSVDRFGNLISDINIHHLNHICKNRNIASVHVKLGDQTIKGLASSYQSRRDQEPLAIIGSRGTIEIAVNRGNAQHYFKADKGDIVEVHI